MFFRKETKIEEYLKRHGSDKGMDALLAYRGIEGVLAYIFILYAEKCVSNDKDILKVFKGTPSEVLMYELAWFDYFMIVYFIDEKHSKNSSLSDSVIAHKLFMNTFSEIATLFENFCGFDRNLAKIRLREYYTKIGIERNDEHFIQTYIQFLENCLGTSSPVEKLGTENLFKFGFEFSIFHREAHARNHSLAMHVTLYNTIMDILKHYNKSDLLFKKK